MVKHKPATDLPWTIREPRVIRGQAMGKLFIEAPKERAREPMAYGLEVLGDDYTGFGDDAAREKDVRYVNHAAHAYPKAIEVLRAIDKASFCRGTWTAEERAANELLRELGEAG